ncbi:hypothetical protein D3C77_287450 [compost metagenome]
MDQVEVFFDQGTEQHLCRQVGRAEQGKVHAATDQLVHDVAGQLFIEVECYLRIACGHRPHQGHGEDGGDTLRQRHDDRAADRVRAAGDGGAGVEQVLEHALGIFIEHLAGFTGDHAVVAAMKQLHAQLVLQCRHLFAQGRLRHMHLARGLGQAAAINHSDKVSDLANFHLGFLQHGNVRGR